MGRLYIVSVSLVIKNIGELVTMSGPKKARTKDELNDLGIIKNGCIVVKDDKIVATGTEEILKNFDIGKAQIYDAEGKLVTPGLVDPHVHLIFDGWEENEYMELVKQGKGNDLLVGKTRKATKKHLYDITLAILNRMVEHGTTTSEAKSGRGLTVESELKQLRVIKELNKNHVIDLVPTFLGAHYIPDEYMGRREEYVDLVINEMIPKVAEENLAEFCDVWCEKDIFTVEDSRMVLNAGKKYGLIPKIHADELSSTGGAELAAEVGAISAEHLLQISDEGIKELAKEGVIANLLPGTPFYLKLDRYAPARKMIEAGVPIGLATDFNPNTSPTESLQIIMNLASIMMEMTAKEILAAVTINAAYSINRGDKIGSLETGKLADIVIWDAPTIDFLIYHFGVNLAGKVFKKGKLVAQNGSMVV